MNYIIGSFLWTLVGLIIGYILGMCVFCMCLYEDPDFQGIRFEKRARAIGKHILEKFR